MTLNDANCLLQKDFIGLHIEKAPAKGLFCIEWPGVMHSGQARDHIHAALLQLACFQKGALHTA
ncbi:hypothetical protein STH12_02799 [Shewanella khirikhana]|uniref:Uncharacterized protein n=1 Tax=Shewanella khirikhana TaxID=1965282 RepID=A0ABM7DQA5_9GAMM|nr:hypothetical protein STH12_02799 [Shewanella khirikhana]